MESNRISRQLKDYLEYKRSLGFKLTHEATVLERFATYTRLINYDGPLTTEIALKWVSSGNRSDKTRITHYDFHSNTSISSRHC